MLYQNAHPLAKRAAFARADVLFAGYLKLVAVPRIVRPLPQRFLINIENHCPSKCGTKYRFRSREDMIRLFKVLRIPEMFKLSNGSKVAGEHLFLVFMTRLAHSSSFDDLVEEYGRDTTTWGRGIQAMARFLYSEHKAKIRNSVFKWADEFPVFAEAMCRVANESINGRNSQLNNPNFEPGNFPGSFPVACVIDCNNTPSCRVGSGPAEPGVNAPRRLNDVQSAFYNGWLHQSGYKHQSVELPNGLTMDWWGPVSMRENDIWMANNSEINGKLAAAQHSNAKQYFAFGDSIYVPDTHIRRRHGAAEGHPNKDQLDREP